MDDATAAARDERAGLRGILAPAGSLDSWSQIVLVVLVVVCAARYVERHGIGTAGGLVLAGAAVLIAADLTRPLVRGRAWWPTLRVGILVALWVALTLVAPSFAWTAVPIIFAALRVLPFPYAVGVAVLMTAVVSIAWLRITSGFDPTLVAGPVGVALMTVIAFRALEQEAQARQRVLEELTDAQADLAAAQRRAGALAERTRLSREIHDSVGQGLSSINLLLNAAEQDWARRPDDARSHVRVAAATARDGLDEVRRVVRDLAPADLDGSSADALPTALQRLVEQAAHGLRAEVRVHGTPVPVASAVAGAIVRTARGGLANAVEHAHAGRVVVSLTYDSGEVLLDVRDDGRGFTPGSVRATGGRGRGLRGIRERAEALGGRASVESAPGEGTTVSVALPTGGGS